jgi:signal transduction histidine kinase
MRFMQQEFDLGDVARQAISRAAPRFNERKLSLVTDLPKQGDLAAVGDAARIGRAIDQLLDNAGKFTPPGGKVGVRARRLASGHFEVCVADTGPGLDVPKGERERLFDPFYQVDGSPTRSHGGTGVGLAIVRGVAIGHGGDARAKSPADEEIVGERFDGAAVYLVIAERPPDVSSLAPPPQA